jgi:hypothetical protein
VGAADLLQHLRAAGIRIVAEGALLRVTPADRLTDGTRDAIRAHKPDLLALLSTRAARPYRLTKAQADAAHARPWDDAAIARFVTRVGTFLRRGLNATDADDLAERLHLRDVQGDDRRLCLECACYRTGRCSNHQRAGLHSADVGRDLATRLQRCPGFEAEPKTATPA